jgi:hypothetical protein
MVSVGFAEYFVWAGAEIAVALVCLAIPTLRPLYTRMGGRDTTGYEWTAGHEPRRPASGLLKRLAAQSSRSAHGAEFHEVPGQEVWPQNYHMIQSSDYLYTTAGTTLTPSRGPLTMPTPARLGSRGDPAMVGSIPGLIREPGSIPNEMSALREHGIRIGD